jgi:multiple antibiotic resistance protein
VIGVMQHWSDSARFLAAILVILNPIGAVPVFLGVTAGQSRPRRNKTGRTAALTVAVVIIVSMLVGEWVLRAFGINLPCFQVGGGILILLLAVHMLHARHSGLKQTPEEALEAEENESVGVVPLGTPLMAGPGTISTAIIFANTAKTWLDLGFLISASLVAATCVWIVLRLAEPIGSALGRTGINILTRLMGLVLAAVAVKFITDGLVQLLPALHGGG